MGTLERSRIYYILYAIYRPIVLKPPPPWKRFQYPTSGVHLMIPGLGSYHDGIGIAQFAMEFLPPLVYRESNTRVNEITLA